MIHFAAQVLHPRKSCRNGSCKPISSHAFLAALFSSSKQASSCSPSRDKRNHATAVLRARRSKVPFLDLRYRRSCAAWPWAAEVHLLRLGFVGVGIEDCFRRNWHCPTLGCALAATQCMSSGCVLQICDSCWIELLNCVLTKVLCSKDDSIFHAALARVGEVSPDVAEYEEAAKTYDIEAARLQRCDIEDGSASEPCTAANDSP